MASPGWPTRQPDTDGPVYISFLGISDKGNPMNKSHLIDQLTEATQHSRKEAERIVNVVFASIATALQSGARLDVRGFGSFQVRDRKARQGRNPRTGETLLIPAKKVAVFKPSKQLAEQLNGAGSASDEASI